MSNKTITEFLNKEYKEYSLYTIEQRAIPSLVDSFKPSQRKIIFASDQIWKTGSEKPMKVFQLAGSVASKSFYHHGNASLESAIIVMCQDFKNNLTLFDGVGQFGDLRSPEAGAPRYIGCKLNKNFRLVYKDFELLEHKEEEGNEIEAKYYLPIIPMVLVNGSSGIAVGFSSNILNRNPKEVLKSTLKYLKEGKVIPLTPYLKQFNGDWIKDPENPKRWIIRGKFEIMNTNTIRITELPPSMTLEKYENVLDDLVEKKLIVSYDDNCKEKIDYLVKFTREGLAKLDNEKLFKLLKLEESSVENFNTIDENGKLKIFESAEDIVSYFVDFRMGYYHKRKEYLINKLESELKVLLNKGKFIKAILDGKLEVKNVSKDILITKMTELGLDKIEDSYDYLLRMPIWSLTKELFDKLKEDFKNKKEEIEKIKNTDPKDMYLNDLTELDKKL